MRPVPLILAVAVVSCLTSCTSTKLPSAITDDYQKLSSQKYRVEQRAAWLKEDFVNGLVAELDYSEGRLLYMDARADVNALVDRLHYELEAHRNPANSAGYLEAVRSAANAMLKFTEFAGGAVRKRLSQHLEGAKAVDQADPKLDYISIADALFKIYSEEYGRAEARRAKKRANVVALLDKLRLLPFEEIK